MVVEEEVPTDGKETRMMDAEREGVSAPPIEGVITPYRGCVSTSIGCVSVPVRGC